MLLRLKTSENCDGEIHHEDIKALEDHRACERKYVMHSIEYQKVCDAVEYQKVCDAVSRMKESI
jgi:hypothetical protein